MSGRFSRGRRYSRSRSYKPWPKRSSLVRRSVGNMRAAKRQTDVSNTTVSGSTLTYTIVVPSNEDYGYQTFNVWDSLNMSPIFLTLRQCYDQLRINNVKVKFSLLQALSMSGTNCPVFASVWDRNGLHPDQYKISTTDFMNGSNIGWSWDVFSSYSSFDKRSMSSGSAFNATLTLAPSNMAEKSMFVSTMDVFAPTADGANSSELCSPLCNPALPFKPMIVNGIFVARSIAQQSFVFSVDWEFDISFRGMHASSQQLSGYRELMRYFKVEADETLASIMGGGVSLEEFAKQEDTGAKTIPAGASLIVLNPTLGFWRITHLCNDTAVDANITVYAGSYYLVVGGVAAWLSFGKDNDGATPAYLMLHDDTTSDATGCTTKVLDRLIDFALV